MNVPTVGKGLLPALNRTDYCDDDSTTELRNTGATRTVLSTIIKELAAIFTDSELFAGLSAPATEVCRPVLQPAPPSFPVWPAVVAPTSHPPPPTRSTTRTPAVTYAFLLAILLVALLPSCRLAFLPLFLPRSLPSFSPPAER